MTAILVAALGVATAFADHNSICGEGWANMPNDIHNTRIDTMDEDSTVFRDFVQGGDAADSVNRFLEVDADTVVSGGSDMGGSSNAGSTTVGTSDAVRGGGSRM
jgi:hypothetical protein